jgi:branched-chain amino acid transport system substrate-binding protein
MRSSAPARPIPRHYISICPGIQFNEKGQNDKLKNAAIQNRAGKFAIIAPKAESDAKPELPMTPYDKRG